MAKTLSLLIFSTSKSVAEDYIRDNNLNSKEVKVCKTYSDISGFKNISYIRLTAINNWWKIEKYLQENNIIKLN